jgi:tetratricopeptide (TPR) repeat protein
MTQEKLAERSGLSVRAISDIERGRTDRPHSASLGLLAAALGVSPPGRFPEARDGPADSGGHEVPAVPRQLPAAVRHFTGRDDELRALTKSLEGGADAAGAVLISAVGGTAGVGKTALAVHWAHQESGRFPDGQLYVNLRGYDPGQPVAATDALAGFLRALGVAGQDIPPETDERAARYRSLLAGRRMLIVLDNAGSEDQVRPLLPGDQACTVIVTSRDTLAGLVARDGAWRMDLDLLPPDDAARLLRELIGARAESDPVATAALAGRCARLPLALRVAAELAVARPAITLAQLVRDLDDHQRLDLLEAGGDARTAIRAVFSWSYGHLSARTGRAFRLLGLHPGPDLDHAAVSALIGTTSLDSRRILEQLARAHLVQPTGPDRYGLHDLLRAYAVELAGLEDGQLGRRTALSALFDHYLATAAHAMNVLYPAERYRRPQVTAVAGAGPQVTSAVGARALLDAERANMVAVAVSAAASGWPGHTTRLARVLFRYLEAGGHYPDAVTIHTHAIRAARLTGDRAAEAAVLNNLGCIDMRLSRYPQATSYLERSLRISCEIGDQAVQARAVANLGLVEAERGNYVQSGHYYEESLALARQIGDRLTEARALGNLGRIERRRGRLEKATDYLEQGLALCQEIGHRQGELYARGNLGNIALLTGRYEQARRHLEQALALSADTGDLFGEAHAVVGLGDIDQRQGRPEQAVARHLHGLALFRRIGDRSGEATALDSLGESYLAVGQPGQGRRQWQLALELYDQLGMPQAAEVRARLQPGGR